MSNFTEEQELIDGCLVGNHRAQEALYNKYAAKMFGVCLRYSSSRMEAEDTLHEGFMAVFETLDRFESRGAFEGWVRRIMINTALKKYKRERVYQMMDFNADVMSESANENDFSPLQKMQTDDLIKLVQKLAPGYRNIFNLYAIEGYNHREIGEVLGISEGTSKSQMARARVLLQAMLNKQYDNEYEQR